MATEIERRFLVRDIGFLAGRSGDRIVQGYVAKEPGAMTTRVRLRAGRGYLTLKSPRYGLSRQEFEYEIPADDARCILEHQCGNRLIRKTRYLVPFAAHVFEIDVFEGRHAGLIVAEVELRGEGEAVALPPWVGTEVTYDKRYSNFALSHFEGPTLPDLRIAYAAPMHPAAHPACAGIAH
ncbi:CYTH domain-containing protein [Aromatoleum sp.]|uniref:CYTH domain-containing protein n=1 Tax=Aromatoleum sp. TaxID=2307007 RepID=UPI002FC734A8